MKRKLIQPQPPKGYPSFWLHPNPTGNQSLVSYEGGVFGFCEAHRLVLYGLRNFLKNGGMAWQMGRHAYYQSSEPVEGVVRKFGKWWWILKA